MMAIAMCDLARMANFRVVLVQLGVVPLGMVEHPGVVEILGMVECLGMVEVSMI